ELMTLSTSLEAGTAIPWINIDAFFARLYGLREYDLQVIRDTLSVALPYETARERACKPPTKPEKKAFLGVLKKALSPLVAPDNGKLFVELLDVPASGSRVNSPFDMLVLTANGKTPTDIGSIANGVFER